MWVLKILIVVLIWQIWRTNRMAQGILNDLFDIKKYLGLRTEQKTQKQSNDEMDVFIDKQIQEGKTPEQAASPFKELPWRYWRALSIAKTYYQRKIKWVEDRKKANKPTSTSDYAVSYNELWRSRILENPDAILATDETYLEQKISDLGKQPT